MSCEGRTVCRGCSMHTWIDRFGCMLPGCPQYAVHVNEDLIRQALDELDERDGAGTPPVGTAAMPVTPGNGAADASATGAPSPEPAPSPDEGSNE